MQGQVFDTIANIKVRVVQNSQMAAMTGTHVAKHKVKDTSATNPSAKADQNESRSYMSYFNIHNKVNSPICTSENIFHLDNNVVINSVSEPCQFLFLFSLWLHFLEVIYL